ncbi:Mu transposase domain-containing protein [Sutterella wadsworthensis]
MRLREETRKVDKTGLIQVDGRHYRVPDEYSQKDVQILMDDHSIMVYRKGDFVIELDKETSVYMPHCSA